MFKISLITILIVLGHSDMTFNEFKAKFGKTYDTDEEQLYRKAVYNLNLQIIEEENNKNLGYLLGVNEWADKTDEQILNIIRNPPPKNIVSQPFVSSNLKVKASTVDWRENCAVTVPKNQGVCGSCWSFSTVAESQSYLYLSEGNTYDLSEEYVLQCTDGSDCTGGVPSAAMHLMISTGTRLQSDYPYKAGSTTTGKPSTPGICTSTNSIPLPSNTTLQTNTDLTFSNMQTLLATSPLTVYFWAPTSFSKYSSGVYSCSRAATVSDLNHGVQVIGYDSSGNYIIKNSWGTGWGYGGFGYVNGNQNKDCGIHMIVLSYQGATLGYSNASTCSTPASGDKLVISCILMIILMII